MGGVGHSCDRRAIGPSGDGRGFGALSSSDALGWRSICRRDVAREGPLAGFFLLRAEGEGFEPSSDRNGPKRFSRSPHRLALSTAGRPRAWVGCVILRKAMRIARSRPRGDLGRGLRGDGNARYASWFLALASVALVLLLTCIPVA